MSAAPFELDEVEAGRACVIAVRAQPRAKRSAVIGLWNTHVKVAVRSAAEDGRANEELLDVLANALELKPSQLELVAGERARQKRVRIACSPAIVRERLIRALGLG